MSSLYEVVCFSDAKPSTSSSPLSLPSSIKQAADHIMPSSQDCAAPHCYNVGSMKCSGCADASYCDRDCQRADWKYHKKTCVSAQKSNCYLLRAKTPEGASSIDVAAHVSI
jgi:hypothetical protein